MTLTSTWTWTSTWTQLSIEEGGRKPSSGAPPSGADEKDNAANGDGGGAAAPAAAAPAAADVKGDSSAATTDNSSNNNHGSGSGSGEGRGSNDTRPVCAAKGCEEQARTDSKYCCESCGVRAAEGELSEAILHSLEMRRGLERGRHVRETRELKTRKQHVREKIGGVGELSIGVAFTVRAVVSVCKVESTRG